MLLCKPSDARRVDTVRAGAVFAAPALLPALATIVLHAAELSRPPRPQTFHLRPRSGWDARWFPGLLFLCPPAALGASIAGSRDSSTSCASRAHPRSEPERHVAA